MRMESGSPSMRGVRALAPWRRTRHPLPGATEGRSGGKEHLPEESKEILLQVLSPSAHPESSPRSRRPPHAPA